MIELVIITCLTANTDVCSRDTLTLHNTRVPMVCFVVGAETVNNYVNTLGPKWTLVKWGCIDKPKEFVLGQ